MKKQISLFICLLLFIGLPACKKNNGAENPAEIDKTFDLTKYYISSVMQSEFRPYTAYTPVIITFSDKTKCEIQELVQGMAFKATYTFTYNKEMDVNELNIASDPIGPDKLVIKYYFQNRPVNKDLILIKAEPSIFQPISVDPLLNPIQSDNVFKSKTFIGNMANQTNSIIKRNVSLTFNASGNELSFLEGNVLFDKATDLEVLHNVGFRKFNSATNSLYFGLYTKNGVTAFKLASDNLYTYGTYK